MPIQNNDLSQGDESILKDDRSESMNERKGQVKRFRAARLIKLNSSKQLEASLSSFYSGNILVLLDFSKISKSAFI